MTVFFEGMLYGLVFILAFGPTFFALFHTALKYGFIRAMAVSLGVITIDGVFISLVILGLGPVLESPDLKFWFGIGGALILLIFGVATWMSKKSIPEGGDSGETGILRFFLKGLALNGLNPLIVLFWIGVVGSVSSLGYGRNDQGWFFGGFLCTVLFMDSVKVFLITKLSKYLTPKRMQAVNRTVGVIFIGFSIRLFVYLIFNI